MNYYHLTAGLVSLAGIGLSGAILARRVNVAWISPVTVSLAAFAMVFVARPLVLAFWPDLARPHMAYLSPDTLARGIAYFLAGLTIWTLVTMLFLWRMPKRAPGEVRHDLRRLELLAFALQQAGFWIYVILFIVYVILPGKLTSLSEFFERATASGLVLKPTNKLYVGASCFLAYCLARRRASPVPFLVLQCLGSILVLSFGGRAGALIVVVGPLMVYVATRRGYVSWFYMSKVAVVVLAVAGMAWFFRGDRSASGTMKVVGVVLAGLSHSTGCGYDYYLGIVDICEHDPSKLRLGQTYTFIFTRPFRGFKRLLQDTDSPGPGLRALVGEPPAGGVPPTVYGEGFWNFGLAGLLLAAAVYGVWAGTAERITRRDYLPLRPLWVIALALFARSLSTRPFGEAIPDLAMVAFVLAMGGLVALRPRRHESVEAIGAPGLSPGTAPLAEA
jgi:hypothetical protein